jgi:glutaredoxin
MCVRENTATPWSICAAFLGLAAAGALGVGGGVAYRLGGARSATEVIAPDIRLMAMPAAAATEENALKAAPDPVFERRLREFEEALAKVWRAGLEDAATGTETEPTGGTATMATAAGPLTTTTTAMASADAPIASATATATADADPPIATGTTTAIADAAPPFATVTTTATASADRPIATATTSAIANADRPTTIATTDPPTATATATATAAAEPAAVVITATVAADASPPDIRVVVYTTSWCGVCKQAKAWMVRHGVAFEDRDVEASADYARELYLRSPRGIIPTFDVEGDVMIGFNARRLVAMMQRAARKQSEGPAL